MKSLVRHLILPAGMTLLLAGCGKKDEEEKFPPYDNTEEVEAFYKAHPERFVFATIDDLPKDLTWENGADLPDIGSPKAKKGGTWYAGLNDFPRTLRHVGPDSSGSFRPYILDNVSMNWVHRHPNVDGWYPGVAKEWAVDRENSTVYIRIDPESRWNDGEKITTEDALFSWYFRTSDYTNAPFGKNFYEENYKKITVYDDYTFAVQVSAKRPDFDSYVFEATPQPRHFYIEHGPDYLQRYQWRFVPTAGPYIIRDEDLKKGRSIVMTRKKDWWAKDRKFWRNRFNPDFVDFKVVRDQEKAFESFLKGDFDIVRLRLAKYWYEKLPDDHPLVKKGYIHKVTFYNEIPLSTIGLWLNTSKPPLDNVHVRRGINYASNFDLVIKEFFRGDWDRLKTASDGYGDASSGDIKPREYSVKKAEEEFAQAGYTKRGPDGVLMNDKGERLSFTVSTGYKTFEDLLTILKQEALKAGVEFKIEVLDNTAGWKKAQEKKHEITFTGTASSPTERYPRYWDFWHSDNAYEDGKPKPDTNNFTLTALPELDKLIDAYEDSEVHEEKIKLAAEMEKILYDHAAWVPGVDMKFIRVGFWRWVQWPDEFNVRLADLYDTYWVHWIDPEMRKETKAAMKEGKTFDPVIKVYDQYKVD